MIDQTDSTELCTDLHCPVAEDHAPHPSGSTGAEAPTGCAISYCVRPLGHPGKCSPIPAPAAPSPLVAPALDRTRLAQIVQREVEGAPDAHAGYWRAADAILAAAPAPTRQEAPDRCPSCGSSDRNEVAPRSVMRLCFHSWHAAPSAPGQDTEAVIRSVITDHYWSPETDDGWKPNRCACGVDGEPDADTHIAGLISAALAASAPSGSVQPDRCPTCEGVRWLPCGSIPADPWHSVSAAEPNSA